MAIQPYLFFDGRCEEAIAFYKKVLGAEVPMMMRFKDNPDLAGGEGCAGGVAPPGDMVMHAELRIGGATIFASDGMGRGDMKFEGVSLSFTVPTEAAADKAFAALADGGQVQMPLGKTFFSPRFGMVADRFGVSWMIYVAPPAA